jgi:hypothetical protein
LHIAFDYFGSNAVTAVFAFIDAQVDRPIEVPQGLFDIADFASALSGASLDPDQLGVRSLALLTTIWDPRSAAVRRSSLSKWLKVTQGNVEFADDKLTRQSAVFLLTVGLGTWDSTGAALVSSSFSKVYQAAEKDDLSVTAWEQLEPNLPWYSPSWDKCARLIRAATRAFVDRPWPIDAFFPTFATHEQLDRAFGEIQRMWGGSRFLRRLKKRVRNRSIDVTPYQIASLNAIDV